jgi:hypothetical protein
VSPNFPVVLVGAALVGAVGSPALTAIAVIATVAGGFIIARRRQIRGY